MSAKLPNTTIVSASGKVLLAGGYLVLDPAYSGIVVSTSSRFYSAILDSNKPNQILVKSPQFVNAEWNYLSTFSDGTIKVDADPASTSTNKFVHLALQETLALAQEIKGLSVIQESLSNGLAITIVGDNDFYSQRATLASLGLPPTIESLSKIPPFALTNVPISQVHKTGLGSSAALITSLTTALLIHLGVIPSCDPESVKHRQLAHNLAQYVHCLAQGKVGSGFDVSAAVFGSQAYTRFDPIVLKSLMNAPGQAILKTVSSDNELWSNKVEPFKLPPLTKLMLADVDAGSDTPSLVGKVLKWRQADSVKANALWNSLDSVNSELRDTLILLSEQYIQDKASYEAIVNYLSSLHSNQWLANPNIPSDQQKVLDQFYQARVLTEEIRNKMREMGTLSGVPIEPQEQTRLLNACISASGVIGGGVPGAGGYDAIWLLVFDPAQQQPPGVLWPADRVEELWSSWTELRVSPLSAVESTAHGVKLEKLEDVAGLKDLV